MKIHHGLIHNSLLYSYMLVEVIIDDNLSEQVPSTHQTHLPSRPLPPPPLRLHTLTNQHPQKVSPQNSHLPRHRCSNPPPTRPPRPRETQTQSQGSWGGTYHSEKSVEVLCSRRDSNKEMEYRHCGQRQLQQKPNTRTTELTYYIKDSRNSTQLHQIHRQRHRQDLFFVR